VHTGILRLLVSFDFCFVLTSVASFCLQVAILILLTTLYLIPLYVMDKRDMRDNDDYRLRRKRARRKFWKLLLFTQVCTCSLGVRPSAAHPFSTVIVCPCSLPCILS
jgi:hypothetical protein